MQKPTLESFCVTPQQTLSVARRAGLDDTKLRLEGIAVLTFNKGIVDRLEELCGLEDEEWISGGHHPYGAAEVVKRGRFQGLDVIVLVPPMGASPLSCVLEDLVACGARAIYLACAAWSLGPPVEFGEIILPAFAVGPDGTSIHYGNDVGEVHACREMVDALEEACRSKGTAYRVGGNATCEALYRVTPQMVQGFRERGCLCMENGEAITLYSVGRAFGVPTGAIFQPYIDLQQGWNPAQLGAEYRDTCRLQAEILLEASVLLTERGLVKVGS